MNRRSGAEHPRGHALWWVWPPLVTGLALVAGLAADIGGDGFIVMMLVLAPLFASLAAVIGTRVPGNPIAWLLLTIAASVPVAGLVSLAVPATAPDPPTFWLAVAVFLVEGSWIFFIFPILLILFLFPTGSFLTPRWRWGGWLAGGMVAVFCLVSVVAERLVSTTNGWSAENPIGFIPESVWEGWFGAIWSAGLAVLAVGGLASMVVRYRRSALDVRTQIRWVVFPTVVFATGYAGSALIPGDRWTSSTVFSVAFAIGFALIPISIAVSIARFRLYDIDRIVSRTVTYALVIGLLVAVYTGATVVLTEVLPVDSNLAVAAATLAAAALFTPLRRRVQRIVDRRFNRTRYQAERELDAFGARLRDATDIQAVQADLIDVIHRTLQPSAVGLSIRGAGHAVARQRVDGRRLADTT